MHNPQPRTTMSNLLIIIIIKKNFHNITTLNNKLNTELQTQKPKIAESEIAVALSRLIFPISKKLNLLSIYKLNFWRYQMYYTGIDLHKFTSYLTTVDSSGVLLSRQILKMLLITSFNTFLILEMKTLLQLNLL